MFPLLLTLLFLLAAFDLYVGVSNDAVNFLNSAVGARAAKYRTLVCLAGIGVLLGCALSNGMMDIARHGVFTPSLFTLREVMLIYVAVMVTDVVLLDRFNSLGMPTSTTVSLVFELLGAALAFTCIKMFSASDAGLVASDFLNTGKALEMIMGIFLSVPMAFVLGSMAGWLARVLFTFDIRAAGVWKTAFFGAFCLSAIAYFMLFKGLKSLSFMQPEVIEFISANVWLLLGLTFACATFVCVLLRLARVNVLRMVVLVGTMALAMAFAGNDLVNFIGVPLAGLSALQDYWTAGGGVSVDEYLMSSLSQSAATPLGFLLAAGVLMVVALATSRKARRVVQTQVSLSSAQEVEEPFGTSRAARALVRAGAAMSEGVQRIVPARVIEWVDSRFKPVEEDAETGAVHSDYDLLRACINLVAASLLIALGTSLRLPLSTTFVTFMVAMGTSLADRAWSRESAVCRVTGVLTVVGGWFLTAGVALSAAFVVAMSFHFLGVAAVLVLCLCALWAIIRSARRVASDAESGSSDLLYSQMLREPFPSVLRGMLMRHITQSAAHWVERYAQWLETMTDALFTESLRPLRRTERELHSEWRVLKDLRRRETICLRRLPVSQGVALSTDFHVMHDALRATHYALLRIAEPAREHVDNHFSKIPAEAAERYAAVRNQLLGTMKEIAEALRLHAVSPEISAQRLQALRDQLRRHQQQVRLLRQEVQSRMLEEGAPMQSLYLLFHLLHETEQLTRTLRQAVGIAVHQRGSF